MTTYTWVGGGNNSAANPRDWSPVGMPQPGDLIAIGGGTMNIKDFTLAETFITTGHETINISQGSSVDPLEVEGKTAINISGTDTLLMTAYSGGTATVDLAANANWIGSFGSAGRGTTTSVTIEGQGTFTNTQALDNAGYSYAEATATIDVNVIGTGNFDIYGGRMEFMKGVGAGQTVYVQADVSHSTLVVDAPKTFKAMVEFGGGEIDLNNLAKAATSYSFQNDLLSIFSGKSVIETLKMADTTPYGFEVVKHGSGVTVLAYTAPTPAVGLPVHTA